jgi:hypothetical protein
MATELHAIARALGPKFKARAKRRVYDCLREGVDPEALDEEGRTALDIAEERNAGWYFGKLVTSYFTEKRRRLEQEENAEEERLRQFPLIAEYRKELDGVWERILEGQYTQDDFYLVEKIRLWVDRHRMRSHVSFETHSSVLHYTLYGHSTEGLTHNQMKRVLMGYERDQAVPLRKARKRAVLRSAGTPKSRLHRLPKEVVKRILRFSVGNNQERVRSIKALVERHASS